MAFLDSVVSEPDDGMMARYLLRTSALKLVLGLTLTEPAIVPLEEHGLDRRRCKAMLRRCLDKGRMMGDFKLATIKLLRDEEDVFEQYGFTTDDRDEAWRTGQPLIKAVQRLPIFHPLERGARTILLRRLLSNLNEPFTKFVLARLRYILRNSPDLKVDDFVSDMQAMATRWFYRTWPQQSLAHIANGCRKAGYFKGHDIRATWNRKKRARLVSEAGGYRVVEVDISDFAEVLHDDSPSPEALVKPEHLLRLLGIETQYPELERRAVYLILWHNDVGFLEHLKGRFDSVQEAFDALGVGAFDSEIGKYLGRNESWVAVLRHSLKMVVGRTETSSATRGQSGASLSLSSMMARRK